MSGQACFASSIQTTYAEQHSVSTASVIGCAPLIRCLVTLTTETRGTWMRDVTPIALAAMGSLSDAPFEAGRDCSSASLGSSTCTSNAGSKPGSQSLGAASTDSLSFEPADFTTDVCDWIDAGVGSVL